MAHGERQQGVEDALKAERVRGLRLSLRLVLDTIEGRQVLAWLIWEVGQLQGRRFAGELDPVKDGLSGLAHDARFDGRRMVAEFLAGECELAAPGLYDVMDTERRMEARRTHARLQDAPKDRET